MLKKVLSLLLLSNVVLLGNCSFDLQCVHDFFKSMNIGAMNVIGCSDKDLLELVKQRHSHFELKYSLIGTAKNVSGIFPLFLSQHYQVGAFFDLTCNLSKSIFMEVSNSFLLNMSFVILVSSDSYSSAIEFLESSTIAFDSIIVLAVNGTLFDVYRIDSKWDLISNEIGNCSNALYLKQDTFEKRTNLNGSSIKTSMVLTHFNFNGSRSSLEWLLDSNYQPEFELLSRLGLSVHILLEEVYNFRLTFNVVDEWGTYNETLGHWDKGMFRDIELNKADIGLSISRIFSRRLDVALYFPPIMAFRSCFLFKHPSTLAEYSALLKPFTLHSWLSTIAFVLICAIFLWFIRKFATPQEPQNDPTLLSSFILVLGTTCQQGLSSDSMQLPTRIITFFLLFGSLHIFTLYGAAVVGFLLTASPRTINTLDKLIQSPLQKYAENLQYHKTHFRDPFNENIEKAYLAIKGKTPDQDRYIDIESGMKKVQKGGTAIYSQDTNLYAVVDKTFTTSEICSLAEIEVTVITIATVINKNSPYKELFYRGILSIRDSGLLNRELKKWNTQRPECLSQEESTAVTLEATVVAHIIYTTGFLLSLIIFISELRIKKLNK